MKKFVLILISIFFVSGCYDYKELNDYSIVTGIAIDKKKDIYEVSVLISNSSKSSTDTDSKESNVVVYTGSGTSIYSAFKDIGLISPKEIYIGSFSILILSDDIAKDGIDDVVDLFLRYPNSRKSFYIVISKGKAKDVLKIMTPLANFPSQNISNNLSSSTDLQGIIGKVSFNKLLSILVQDGIEPTINTIKVIGDEKKGSKQSNLESTKPKTYVKLDNLAIFKGYKLIDIANKNESIGINFINGNVKETYLKIKYNDGYVIIDTTKVKTCIKPIIDNNTPKIKINIKGEAKIVESNGNIDLENYKIIEKLQKLSNKKIKKIVNQGIDLAKKNDSDVFGFGLKFYQKYPKFFEKSKDNWNIIFKNLNIDIKTKIIIKNKVSSKNSLEGINE